MLWRHKNVLCFKLILKVARCFCGGRFLHTYHAEIADAAEASTFIILTNFFNFAAEYSVLFLKYLQSIIILARGHCAQV